MRVEAGVTKLRDLLCKQFYTVCGVAEDDGLVDLEFREKCVEAMNFLLFFHEGVILGDTTQGELVHEINLVWSSHVLVLQYAGVSCHLMCAVLRTSNLEVLHD